MRGVHLQDALVGFSRRTAVSDLLGPDRGNLHQNVYLVTHRRERSNPTLQHVDTLLPAPLLREQRLQGRQGRGISRIDLQHMAPRFDSRIDVHQRAALQLAKFRVAISQRGRREGLAAHGDQPAQSVRELLPSRRAPVVGRNGLQRLDVSGIDLDDLLPALKGVSLAAELFAPHVAEAFVRRDARFRVFSPPNLTVQNFRQLAPFPSLLVQVSQGRKGHRVGAAQIEHPPPQLDGMLALVEHIRRNSRHARVAIGKRFVARSDVKHLLVDLVQVFPLLGAEVDALQGLQGFRRA